MRAIKFRGKCVPDSKYAGEWVEGGYVPLDEISSCKNKGEGLIVVFLGGNCSCSYHVIAETVGEFTGLHDKNGKEIYEGDIVEFYTMKTYCINPDCEPHLLGYGERLIKNERAVKFLDGMFGVEGDFDFVGLQYCCILEDDLSDELKKDPYFDSNGYDINSIIGIKVIDNIHDNPKLLEQ